MKAAIFWGNRNLHYKEEPVICENEEAQYNKVMEEMLIDNINKSKCFDTNQIIPMLPGFFILIEGEEDHLIKLKIDNLDLPTKKPLKDYLIHPFLFLSDLYDPESHRLKGDKKDFLLSLGCSIFLFEGEKERISLRIDKGLVETLKPLGKNKIGDYIQIKIADLVLQKHFQIGGLREKIEGGFMACFDTPNLIIATEKGFKCLMTENVKTSEYKETGQTLLVDYAINKFLLETLRNISKKEDRTMTSLIKEAIIPRKGRWEEIELRSI